MEPEMCECHVRETVCVVGAVTLGLAAIKNLVEQGLDVEAFERNGYVGGIWHAGADASQATAFPATRLQASRATCSFSDFPIPGDPATHPSAEEYGQYLEAYAQHFDIIRHIRFSTSVTSIQRSTDDCSWLLTVRCLRTGLESTTSYRRMVMAVGSFNVKNQPLVPNIQLFTGDVIHTQELEVAAKYQGKTVLVVGLGASSADTLSFLHKAGAKKLYLSHRSSFYTAPPMVGKYPVDYYMTLPRVSALRLIASLSPYLASYILGKALQVAQRFSYPFLTTYSYPLLSLRSVGAFIHHIPFVSDELPLHLKGGICQTASALSNVTGPRSVACADGTEIIELDTIIFCTGYRQGFPPLRGPGSPFNPELASDGFDQFRKAELRRPGEEYPRLYQGFLSEQYPDSLALLGHLLVLQPGSHAGLYDLVTMALASLWSGRQSLPSRETMKQEIDAHYEFVVGVLQRGPMAHLGMRIHDGNVHGWLNGMAGTGVVEKLGWWTWESWKFWWYNRELYAMLMSVPAIPALYRLLETDGGRARWEGALEYIQRIHEEMRACSLDDNLVKIQLDTSLRSAGIFFSSSSLIFFSLSTSSLDA